MRTLWRILVGIFGIIGLVVVLGGIGAGVFFARSGSTEVAQGTVITLDLTQAPPDQAPDRGIDQLLYPHRLTLIQTLNTIERAGNDPHVAGLVARIGDTGMGLAEVEELRDAI